MKKPNLRIKKVFEKSLESIGRPIGEIMREEGYAPSTADNPKLVTQTKSWEMLSEEYLPDSEVFKQHKEALTATKVISAISLGKADEKTTDFVDVPDYPVRLKAVELAYKIKGRLNNDNVNILNTGPVQIVFTRDETGKN